jgi:5-methylcytosine-specific restriction endonuclease McrA
MTKKERQIVFDKFGGKCAYCGCELIKGWHVDHLAPVVRRNKTIKGGYYINKSTQERVRLMSVDEDNAHEHLWIEDKVVPAGFDSPENDTIENCNPACASCNIQKSSNSLEGFRQSISQFVNSLNQYHNQYKFAKRYGLIKETGIEVKFYYETFNQSN